MPQSYDKNPENQPGWVSIQVPAIFADCLKGINFKYDNHVEGLAMILNPDVFDAITNLFTGIEERKKCFDSLLFDYLFGIAAEGGSNILEKPQVSILFSFSKILTSGLDYKLGQSGKEVRS